MSTPKLTFIFFLLLSCCFTGSLYAQPTWTLNPFGTEKKPEQYEEKKLASEKTGDSKLTTFRRVVQNNVTHYNYYFNANNKLNGVIERAKMSQKEDYSKLLSFYPYTLENTALQKTELDSVIYKATAGILLHDLRTDWVDNMYLLIGKAYYFRQQFDSAALTFQFINYNLFPRKKNEDDSRVVGTNDEPGTGALSIANKEKRNIAQKIFSLPPSRNDALIWLTRTFIDQEEYGDAAGLINILQHDKNLPGRLKNDLEEVTAYWFFAQHNLDSTSVHLEKALSNAADTHDKSRWEFLLAQLYEINGQFDKASDYYFKAARHTTDPVMDIFARLNEAKMMRNSGNSKELQNSISTLLKMARKDKYENYRDIIYYSTGQLSLQVPDTANAILSYQKSVHYNNNNIPYKNMSFLELADIAYVQKRYVDAHSFYDSLDLADKSFPSTQIEDINSRKESLGRIVEKINMIKLQDSLQVLAAMSPADRDALIKKMVRKYRKAQGLKEEDNSQGSSPITFNNTKNVEPADLFSVAKGEWYFYNPNAKSRGFSEFKQRWGKRENVDNWQRKSAVEAALSKTVTQGLNNYDDPDKAPATPNGTATPGNATAVEFSYDALMADVPLTQEKIDTSNQIIAENLFALAKLFQNELLDYGEAINTYNEYLKRFPKNENEADVYLGLYYCYSKIGDQAQANYYKNIVTNKYAGTTASTKILNPSLLDPNKKSPEVTQKYADIYSMFLEGRFTDAIASKKTADSLYGTNYWSPQLLYIEAVYHIKEKNDSAAIALLKDIEDRYPMSPLKAKAATMIEVLGRRAEIEQYLTDLKITRAEEDKTIFVDEGSVKPTAPEVKPVVTAPVQIKQPVIKPLAPDTLKTPPQFVSSGFKIEPSNSQFVAMILDKVDGVYINEAKNAFSRFNRGSYYTQNIVITRDAIDGEKTLLLFSPFEDMAAAIAYYDKIKKAAPSEVSWLPAAKYSFIVISAANLEVLKTNKDLPGYKKLLNTNYDNKF